MNLHAYLDCTIGRLYMLSEGTRIDQHDVFALLPGGWGIYLS